MLQKYKIYFADLHFHTNYSDNRDRATIKQIVSEGIYRGISIFGIGDHNHNLTLDKWYKQTHEVKETQREFNNILIWSNCEITFQMGHFLIIDPSIIDGSIEEGYYFLYKDRRHLKILNHPDPHTDEWGDQLIPFVSGIEVINGVVFKKAIEKKIEFESPLDIPSIKTYAFYLKHNYPVAAMGNSDAHAIEEIGLGLTGFRFSKKPNKKDIIKAIQLRKTFATNDPGISVIHDYDKKSGKYSWKVTWKPLNHTQPESIPSPDKHKVELYNMDKKVLDNLNDEGCINLTNDGLYWMVAYNKKLIALTSPIKVENIQKATIVNTTQRDYRLYSKSVKDINHLGLKLEGNKRTKHLKRDTEVIIDIYSNRKHPVITDSAGKIVRYHIIDEGEKRKIIDKECNYPCFEEFLIWLKRNEIHEYNFLKINYSKVKNLFSFEALLIPSKMTQRKDINTWFREDLEKIENLINEETKFRLLVEIMYKSVIKLEVKKENLFPLLIDPEECKLSYQLVWYDNLPTQHYLNGILKEEEIKKIYSDPWQHLFQIFVMCNHRNKSKI